MEIEGNWIEALPEDLKGAQSLADYKLNEGEEPVPVPVGLVKSYVEQQKLIGADKVVLPGENATEEEWSTFYSKLGRPEAPDGYELKKDGMPEEFPYNENMEKAFRETAHKLGVPKKAAEGLFNWYMEANQGVLKEAEEQLLSEYNKGVEELKKEWGDKFEEYSKIADRVFHTFFPEQAREPIRLLLGNDPMFVKALYDISKATGEDKLVAGDQIKQTGAVKTMDELKEMMRDPRYRTDEAYFRQVTAEFEKAFPGQYAVAPTGPGQKPGAVE